MVRAAETLCDDYMKKVESHSVSVFNQPSFCSVSRSTLLACTVTVVLELVTAMVSWTRWTLLVEPLAKHLV